jgi:hypothetical protein
VRIVFEAVDGARDAVFNEWHVKESGIDADVFINDRDRLPAHHAEAPGRKERKGHKPDETLKPSGKIETACYKADRAIQQVLDQLAA